MIKRLVVFFAAFSVLFIYTAACYGGVADTWLQQHTSTSPGYFQGQKRGYYTAGSFSARLNTVNEYPISVQLPRLKAGCAGIDAFGGGFSFLNFDYLVKFAQNVLQASPFVAFDIALNVLCEQCSNAMKAATSLANQLNSVQLNSCAASKAAVAYMADQIPGLDQGQDAKLHSMYADYYQSTGLGQLYEKASDTYNSVLGDPTQSGQNASDMLAGCPPMIQAVFGSSGLLLENVADYIGLDTDYTDFIRAMVGDANITVSNSGGNNAITTTEVAPCQNVNIDRQFEDMSNGFVTVKTGDDQNTCQLSFDQNSNLLTYVSNMLQGIVTALKSHTKLTADQEQFIQNCPLPVFKFMSASIVMGQSDLFVQVAADPIAKAYATRMLQDAYSSVYGVIRASVSAASATNQSPVAGQNPVTCSFDLVRPSINALQKVGDRILDALDRAKKAQQLANQETERVMNFSKLMQDYEDKARGGLVKTFGSAIRVGR